MRSSTGTLKALQAFLSVVVILISFGLGQALNRFIPEIRLQGTSLESRGLLYRSLLVQSGIWVVVCAGMRCWRARSWTRGFLPMLRCWILGCCSRSVRGRPAPSISTPDLLVPDAGNGCRHGHRLDRDGRGHRLAL
ncbi:MAG: hypothetical protein R3E12_01340 [Candidatus Eisenbacteria bacterium]